MAREQVLVPGVPQPPFSAASAVRADDWVFLGGSMATDWETGLAAESRSPSDFPFGEYAMHSQTHHVMEQIQKLLAASGTSLENMVRIDQFIPDWDQFRLYLPVRNLYLTKDRPASTAVAVQSLLVPGAEILIDGIAVIPTDGKEKEAINNPAAPEPKAGYSLAIRYGDWVWCSGSSPTDFRSRSSYPGGLGHTQPDGVWVDPNFAYDSAIERQAEYCLYKLALYLEEAGSDLQHVVKAQVYLTDCSDLPGLMQVWNRTWRDSPPATTVVPIDRMMIGGSRCEINVIAVTKGGTLKPEVIQTDDAPPPPFNAPQAVKVGKLLFLSGQHAIDEFGIDSRARRDNPVSPHLVSPGRDEFRVILEHVEAICAAAGGSVADIARVQLFSTDMKELGAALGPWNETFIESPPTLSIIGVTGPHVVPALSFAGDFTAFIPQS